MSNFKQILKTINISRYSFYLLIILVVLSFSITFYLLIPNNNLVKDPQNLQYFLIADIIFVLVLFSIIIRQVLLYFLYRKKNFEESRLYIKFVNLFTAMALVPAIGVVIITSLFFNLELKTWYSGAVKEAIVNSNIVSRNYENEIQEELISDTQLILREIIKVSKNNEVRKFAIERVLNEFINIRTISNIYLFTNKGEVILSIEDKNLKYFTYPSNQIFDLLEKNQVYIFQQDKNSISAYKKINFLENIYIQINRNLNTNIWEHISKTQRAYEIYTQKEEESTGIQITFSMIFVLFCICFILIAVLIGFNLARRLSKPISNLIQSANEISKGNFEAKVSEEDQFEEVKVLLSSYNKMINEIKLKQDQLISKNNEDEAKRIFIEAILSLLATGVISLDENFNINFFNHSSLSILNYKSKDFENKNFLAVFPEWENLIYEFKRSEKIFTSFNHETIINDNSRNLNLKIIKEISDGIITGFVVTIDDMTSLILAEKHAAWSDIARKIAHEVKNPLTPIKLSAERIEKKTKENSIDINEVNKLTQTISKQVDDIGKLVDEFSSFARMPEAEIKLDNLSEVLKESVQLYLNSQPKVNIKFIPPKTDIYFQFDRFQMSQAVNNIIKNALEAVINIPNPSITINLSQNDNLILISVIDNGVGIDQKNISKLFEPYYTTKEKGTGLGLSIVKKIIEDHSGNIKIEKNKNMTGTTTIITFNIK